VRLAMIDEDEIDYPDDWYDDMPEQHLKEEPDCGACSDAGCRSCQPTGLQFWWWRATWRITNLRWRLRMRRHHPNLYDDEPPF
jgi:hypothetical protein